MRKNCRWTFDAWRAGRSLKPAESIWTDGTTVYSYQTAIAVTLPSGVILNRTPYSVTTTTHQNGLAVGLEEEGTTFLVVENVPIGTMSLTE